MLKTIILLQTCLLCAVATASGHFNFSLSFPSHLEGNVESYHIPSFQSCGIHTKLSSLRTSSLLRVASCEYFASLDVDKNDALNLSTSKLAKPATRNLQQNNKALIENHLSCIQPYAALTSCKTNDLEINNQFQAMNLSLPFYSNIFRPFTSSSLRVVVIDAGHGGHDPGCLGAKSHEKDIALAIAKKLAAALRKAHPELKVILTRSTDVFIPLYERAAIANRNNADLFISIHCNSMPPGNSKTNGTETFVMGLHTAKHNLNVAKRENASILLEADYEKNYDYDPNSPEGHIMLSMFQNAYLEQSILFAEKIELQFKVKTKRNSRGVKQAGFVVLKETTMPSVLIETGFLSNKKEENYLRTAEGQNAVTAAISKAFTQYKTEIDNNTDNYVSSTYDFEEPVKRATPKRVAKPQQISSHYKTYEKTPVYKSKPTASRKKPVEESPIVFYAPETETDGYKVYPGTKPNNGSKPTYTLPNTYAKGRYLEKERNSNQTTNNEVQFRVQLAASPNPLNTRSAKWRNTGYLIEVVNENNLYKYQARNFSTYKQATQAKSALRIKGFPDAFVVAYKLGERVSLEEARR